MRRNNRETILETARKLFLLQGYNGVSIRAIAAESNLTTGAVYFHFKNKRDIYNTICSEAIDILYNKFTAGTGARQTPPQKLIATFDSFIAFYYENREHYNILMEYKSAYDAEEEPGKNIIARRLLELMEIITGTFREGIAQGIYRTLDPIKLALLLAAVAEGMLQYKKLGIFEETGITDRDFREFMDEVIGRGILA